MWSEEELKRMYEERDAMHLGFEAEDNSSCEDRYYARIAFWIQQAGSRSYRTKTKEDLRGIHDRWWLVHNLIAHPALGLFPCDVTLWLHNVTSAMLNDDVPPHTALPKEMPDITDRWSWFVHNFIAHIGIGLFPGKSTFAFHDKTANEMNVPGWV